MPCSKAKKYDNWCKEFSTVEYNDEEGNEYCVFHAPQGKKGISVEKFNELVFEEIRKTENNEYCDLSGTIFEGDIWFSNFNKDNPLPRVIFSEATFSGSACFFMVTFSGKADFFAAKFYSDAYFSGATFCGFVSFVGAKFNKKIDFMDTIFNEEADFFTAIFNGEAIFNYVTFKKECFLRNVKIKNTIEFEDISFKEVSFMDTDMRKIDYSINCKWPTKYNRKVIYDEITLFRERKYKNYKDNIEKIEVLYRQLKQKCKEEHNEYEVSNWHYGEKEMQRKGSSWKDFSFYLLNLYWVSSGYGEYPVRAGVVLLFLIIYASWLLAIAGLTVPYDSIPNGIDKSIYGISNIIWPYDFDFKKVLALFLNTLKYATFQKDYFFKPLSWFGETVKILAQIIIPLQTALFALAVRNKFRR